MSEKKNSETDPSQPNPSAAKETDPLHKHDVRDPELRTKENKELPHKEDPDANHPTSGEIIEEVEEAEPEQRDASDKV